MRYGRWPSTVSEILGYGISVWRSSGKRHMADPKSTQGFVHYLLEPLLAEVYCLVGDSERVMRLFYCEAAEELALAFSQIRSEMGYHSRCSIWSRGLRSRTPTYLGIERTAFGISVNGRQKEALASGSPDPPCAARCEVSGCTSL